MSNLLSIQLATPIQSLESRGSPVSSPVPVSDSQGSIALSPKAGGNETSPSGPDPKASRETLQKAVDHANKTIHTLTANELHFSIDKDTGIEVVKLTDKQTGELIRQIPSKEMLEIAKLIEAVTGSLISQQA